MKSQAFIYLTAARRSAKKQLTREFLQALPHLSDAELLSTQVNWLSKKAVKALNAEIQRRAQAK